MIEHDSEIRKKNAQGTRSNQDVSDESTEYQDEGY